MHEDAWGDVLGEIYLEMVYLAKIENMAIVNWCEAICLQKTLAVSFRGVLLLVSEKVMKVCVCVATV